ncbi:uncharacterized protein LOC144153962 isoform X3 [Haemaphysalis longicornis]
MSASPAHGITALLRADSLVEAASSAASVALLAVLSFSAAVGALLFVAKILHSKMVEQLKGLPQIREYFPFQTLWILMRACNQPMSPAGFSALIFDAVRGHHATFQRFGLYLWFSGFMPMLTVFKPEYVEEILSSHKMLTKAPQYAMLHSWLGTGLLTSNGEKWHGRRRLFAPAFHFRILEDFIDTINAQSLILATKLAKPSSNKENCNVVPLVTACTLDIVCETVMGTTISAQSDENSPYVVAVYRMGRILIERIFKPLLQADLIFKLSPVGREYNNCLDSLHSFTRKVIAERKKSLRRDVDGGLIPRQEDASSANVTRKIRRPFMDLLLLEHFKGNITEDGIREEVDTFMFAGHDTTATGIIWALFLIGHHSEHQQLIHDELDSIFGDDIDRCVTSEDLKQMMYLECAIKESQRIYPSVPVIGRTCTEPFTIGGFTLPEGAIVQVVPYFLHRDPNAFPKPEEFHPERFLPENAKGRHPYAYLPFSGGPRSCIGQKFALAVEKIVLANILRRFKVSPWAVMSGISLHWLSLLSVDSLLEMCLCAVRTFLIIVASSAVLVGSLIWVSRIIQSKTLKQLEEVPRIRQHFPFQQEWIIMRSCIHPMAPVKFNAMVFAFLAGFHAVFQKFGRYVVYLGFKPLVILFKAEYAEEALSSNKMLAKGSDYELFHDWLGDGLLTSVGEKWRYRRRLFTPAFHFRILDEFMGTINAESFILAAKLGELSRAKQPFDVLHVVTMCALDILCETVMGTTINAQSNPTHPYVTACERLSEHFLDRMLRPLLRVNLIFQLSSVGREHRKCLKTVHSFARKVIAERKAALRKEIDSGLITLEDDATSTYGGRKAARPMMDRLLLEHFKGNITEDGVREEVDSFMFGGHDTVATGISWALFLIGHYPDKQQLIHDELDLIFGDDKDRYVNPEDVKQMKYLECALKESQRVYPSAPYIARNCTEPVTIGGVDVPKNAEVLISPYLLHRDPKVFPKPEEFIPERFLPENSKGRHPYAYIPFSAGPRNCIGQKFALAEEKIVIANLLRRFKVKSIDHRDEVALVAEIVLRPRSGLRMQFIPR